MAFPDLGLEKLDVWLGFHEDARGSDSIAPSALSLRSGLNVAQDPASIWRSVVLKAIASDEGPKTLKDRVQWLEANPEVYEDSLLKENESLESRGRSALVVFDALDVLATDWSTIRTLTQGLARVALELSSLSSVNLKIFMRSDQYIDMSRRSVPDFSKLKTSAVDLSWDWEDLYGVLFSRLYRSPISKNEFLKVMKHAGVSKIAGTDIPEALKTNSAVQDTCFTLLAGEFMGATKKRGRTYSWLPKHLADAAGDTSLRSFLISLRVAAENVEATAQTVVSATSINEGVRKASETKVEEIVEDNPWIKDALSALSGLTVPCDQKDFLDAWIQDETVKKILARKDAERPSAPLQISVDTPAALIEVNLLSALEDLAIIERRGGDKINVPDIFRTAANMKRRGGISLKKRGR
jgi:hypothetical protein